MISRAAAIFTIIGTFIAGIALLFGDNIVERSNNYFYAQSANKIISKSIDKNSLVYKICSQKTIMLEFIFETDENVFDQISGPTVVPINYCDINSGEFFTNSKPGVLFNEYIPGLIGKNSINFGYHFDNVDGYPADCKIMAKKEAQGARLNGYITCKRIWIPTKTTSATITIE